MTCEGAYSQFCGSWVSDMISFDAQAGVSQITLPEAVSGQFAGLVADWLWGWGRCC